MVSQRNRFLVYCPCRNGKVAVQLYGPGPRLFDVALNEYAGSKPARSCADYAFAVHGHKWKSLYKIVQIMPPYDAYCFMDDDVEISTAQINTLFEIGMEHRLNLWQAAMTWDSYEYWEHLFYRPYVGPVRPTRLVEIMAPCFSRKALVRCLPTFDESYCGWGLDQVWPKLLNYEGIAVVDHVQMAHRRPIQSDQWVLPGGVLPHQEATALRKRYGLEVNHHPREYMSCE